MSLRKDELLHNRYRIVKQLGEGGFGAVYRAVDTSLKTNVAVKENLEYWDVAQKQFEREAVLLANLRHSNLPRVTDFFTVPAQGQYLVMDFIEGYDLQTVLERVDKPLHSKRVFIWIDQICDALDYLHSQQPPIIHRDIKPANIRITPQGRAILVDFGLAKRYDPDIKTITGARAVTPGYSPVEQYGEETTDARTDQYALGATTYALLTGKRPLESIARVTGKSLTAPRKLNPDISPAVEHVISHAMQVHPENRFPSIGAFREALREANKPPDLTKPPTNISGQSRTSAFRLSDQGASTLQRSDVLPEWITIPAGTFILGEERGEFQLSEFQITKFPVTNLQYQVFLADNPRQTVPAYWKGREAPSAKLHHPVVGVSLDDALAFCQWLECRLPSQEEWEKAARGPDGRTYPWGEFWEVGKYCNNWETQIHGTTSVERYPAGISPYGVWDLAGNVWEWTDSDYQGPFMRVLRGGSWRSYGNFAVRAVHFDSETIDDRRDDLGFRCARSI